MSVLAGLSPERVFYYFERIAAIPHPSGDTAALRDYCAEFAKAQGLRYATDNGGNVVIYKPASAGYEEHPTLILQGHLDMVCEAEESCKQDFTKEGIKLRITGDTVRACGTTLGADNGIAVAMALAILEDDSIPHPPLEVLFTADEEVGLLGAAALDGSLLSGRRLINIDSEDEGVFTVACAGGLRAEMRLPVCRSASDGYLTRLSLSGYLGGHSGIEIGNGRRNAILDLFSLLRTVPALRLVGAGGGGKDNAIPRTVSASVLTPSPIDESALQSLFSAFLKEETEAALVLEAEGYTEVDALTEDATKNLLSFTASLPNGVLAMSRDIEGLVETSLNLGVLSVTDEEAVFASGVRSSVNSDRAALSEKLSALTEAHGGDYKTHGEYPAWEYRKDSPLRDAAARVFEGLYGFAPRVEAIHAGLECGLLSDKLLGLDSISMGPELHHVHTPEESMSISSVARTYDFLLELIKEL